jgi:hypothetical protein
VSRGLLVLAGCVGVLVLSGCGGSSDSDSASTAASTTAEATTTPQPPNQNTTAKAPEGDKQGKAKSNVSNAKQGDKDSSSSSSPKKHLKLVKVPAISSAPKAGSKRPAPGVKTVKDGDNSVQEYGVEADEAARREAAIALQGYLNARAKEDWGTACSLLAKKPAEQLERVQRAAAKQGQELNGCPGTMALLKEGEAQTQEQAQITEVLSLRGGGEISGDPSYLIFTAPPGNTLFSMPMYLQGGAWKVGLARAAELPVG